MKRIVDSRWMKGLKWALTLLSLLYIAYRIASNDNLALLPDNLLNFTDPEVLFFLVVVLVLMPLNWGIEALKWKYMIRPIEKLSLQRANWAIYSGVAMGFMTISRIGEFPGRVLHLHEGNRVRGIIITAMGGIAQMCITIIAGSLAFLRYTWQNHTLSAYMYVLLVFLVVVLLLLLLVLSYNPRLVYVLVSKIKGTRKHLSYAKALLFFSKKEISIILLLSLLRYSVFVLQYYFMFCAFGIHASPGIFCERLSLMFLSTSIIPGFALYEWGIKTSATLYFFQGLCNSEASLIFIAGGIWLINTVLPSLIGSFGFLLLRLNKGE